MLDNLVTSKGITQQKLLNRTINSNAYQDNAMNDIKLQYVCIISQAFNKITYYVIALQSYCVFIRSQGSNLIDYLTVVILAP